MVSNASITGAKRDISAEQVPYFERIAAMNLDNPRLIGFGISNHDTFEQACSFAQGAIIGSAFIKHLQVNAGDVEAAVASFVQSIRSEAYT